MWNYTLQPNDHYVTLKGEPNTFGSAGDVIMYCWHDVPGLQKFGTYTGAGSAYDRFHRIRFPSCTDLDKRTSTGGTNYDWVDF